MTEVLAQIVPWTLGSGTCASRIIACTLARCLGIFPLGSRFPWQTGSCPSGPVFLTAFPTFGFPSLVLYVFAYALGWFPLAGGYDIYSRNGLAMVLPIIHHAVLPLSTIVITPGGWMLTMRKQYDERLLR